MKQGARLESLRDILKLFLETPQSLNHLLKLYFGARRYMGSKDRQFIKDHLFSIFRHWEKVKWGISLEPRTLILSYLIRILKWTSQDFDENLEASNYALTPLTEIEHQFYFDPGFNTVIYPDHVLANVPEFLWSDFQHSFDHRIMEHARALCGQASLDLRVNTLQTTRIKVLKILHDLGIDAVPTIHSMQGIRVSKRLNLESFPPYKFGYIEVQDEGSQLLADFCDVRPHETVLDLCAGAGGKTLALSALMKNQGKIIATDIDGKRLKKIYDRLDRAKVHNVEVIAWPLEKALGSFDVVLVDSPCSGTGTWRRAPDLRARWTPEMQGSVLKTQEELLTQASMWVRTGGKLIYTTCSLLSSENERQIDRFLEQYSNFEKTRDIKFSPLIHQTDGFYGAELKRIA